VFLLEPLIPVHNIHHLFYFLEGFVGSGEVRDKVICSFCGAVGRGLRGLGHCWQDQLIPEANMRDDVLIKVM
jgi:hypothetical protein